MNRFLLAMCMAFAAVAALEAYERKQTERLWKEAELKAAMETDHGLRMTMLVAGMIRHWQDLAAAQGD